MNSVTIPAEALLAGASTEDWRTPLEIRKAARLDSDLHRNAITPKLRALVSQGRLLERRNAPATRGRITVYRLPATVDSEPWFTVTAQVQVRAPDARTAERRITTALDARKIAGLFAVGTFRVDPTESPLDRARRTLQEETP